MTSSGETFEEDRREVAAPDDALLLDLDGYEGPIDILLTLAREQKVDLRKISILALADQYLAFIQRARQLRLEIAADYLVMAAWLAYLKSRLLLPETEDVAGPTAEDMAAALALQLRRLEAFRAVAAALMERPQLDRDVFARGAPEPIVDIKHPEWTATLYDLLSAYAAQRQKHALARVQVPHRTVWSLSEARVVLERLIGAATDWTRIDAYLLAYVVEPSQRATALASGFAATLELVREGAAELHQHAAFAPLYLRKRTGPGGNGNEASGATTPAAANEG
jgi:segregation and condensation protein A